MKHPEMAMRGCSDAVGYGRGCWYSEPLCHSTTYSFRGKLQGDRSDASEQGCEYWHGRIFLAQHYKQHQTEVMKRLSNYCLIRVLVRKSIYVFSVYNKLTKKNHTKTVQRSLTCCRCHTHGRSSSTDHKLHPFYILSLSWEFCKVEIWINSRTNFLFSSMLLLSSKTWAAWLPDRPIGARE